MKNRFLAIVALLLVSVITLSSCSIFDWFFTPVKLTDKALQTEKLIDFAEGANPDVLFESDGWSNGDVFNVVWKKHNVHYENGIMRLGITEEKASAWLNDAEVEFNYTAGEARTQNYYHYGDYEVSMKPSANGGTASTFFVCTGPYDTKFVLDENGDYVLDENGQRKTVANAHDEIDIEFLGKDTTHVQFNFFVDGVGGNEYMHDLGFDASEGFHTYGFRWLPDSITWFVDGEPVYKVTTDKDTVEAKNIKIVDKLPSTAGRILTNYWCGNERAWGWMGAYQGAKHDQGTEYQWIATSAEGNPLNPPEKPSTDTTEIDWTQIAPVAPTFPSAEKYVVSVDGNKANVTYTDVGGSEYKPIEMGIADLSAGKNYVHLTVTNNGTEPVQVRVNVIDQALVDAGAQNMATNISATQDGVAVNTDLVWGGSFFEIAGGATSELVVHFGGVVEALQLMIDSSRNDQTLRSGDITVEDIKFATVGTVELPHECADGDADGKCDECGKDLSTPPAPPAHPETGDKTVMIDGVEITFDGNLTDGYGFNANDENNTINVKYNDVIGNSYKNFWAGVASIAGTKTTFTMKVTNNGTEPAKVRIDIESQTQVNANTTCCNLSSTQDGAGAFTDLEWGGSTFVVEAGATSTLVVVYDASKLPTNLKIFVDSCQWDDGTSHAGDITISEMSFSGEYVPEEGTDDPVEPPVEEPKVEYTDLYVEFKTENAYTLVSPDTYANSVRVTYTDIAQNSWNNINIWIDDKSQDCSIFSMKLTNHGASQVSVWVQMKDAAGAELINQNVNIAAGAEETFVFEYTGKGQMIFFFVDSTHEAAAGPNAGDITISELKLGKAAAAEEPIDPPAITIPEGEYLKYIGNECYSIIANGEYVNSVRVTYTAVSDNTYQNVNTWIQDKAAGKTKLEVFIKNEGAETVNITVKLENGAGEAGEAKATIAPGETVAVTIEYGFAPDLLYFFIDSGWSTETASHSGDITISGVNFQ